MQELKYQFQVIQAIRNFFKQKGFIDVMTPPMVQNPGMETHIHPFEVFSKRLNKSTNMYLHTSPEFHMKKILANIKEFQNIFTLTYSFRDEPNSEIHRNQFVMCEWYRKNAHYEKIMDDCENLILHVTKELQESSAPLKIRADDFKFTRRTVQEIFDEFLHFDILDFLESKDLKEKIQKDFRGVPIPSVECEWDDYFFLLFLNEIEPHLKKIDYLLLYEFPHHLSALSTIKQDDPRVCERFEIYLRGIELCNCFNELTDYKQQKQRFDSQKKLKQQLYHYSLPDPEEFYQVLKNGHPQSSGIALGVERLLYSLVDVQNPFF